jgi:hypothetical protein
MPKVIERREVNDRSEFIGYFEDIFENKSTSEITEFFSKLEIDLEQEIIEMEHRCVYNVRDCELFLTVYRKENDFELDRRLKLEEKTTKKNKISKEEQERKEFEHFLKLKKKFEGTK